MLHGVQAEPHFSNCINNTNDPRKRSTVLERSVKIFLLEGLKFNTLKSGTVLIFVSADNMLYIFFIFLNSLFEPLKLHTL